MGEVSRKHVVMHSDANGVDTIVGNLTNSSDVSLNVDSGFAPAVGVYTLVVTATDNACNINVSDPVFFVVYDPDGGHATGGGWFYPDNESTRPDGKANFGFTAKYKDNNSTGKLNFQYKDAGIHLKSTSIDWLTQYFRNYRVPNTIPSHATIQPQSPREHPPKPSRIHSNSAKTHHPSAK